MGHPRRIRAFHCSQSSGTREKRRFLAGFVSGECSFELVQRRQNLIGFAST